MYMQRILSNFWQIFGKRLLMLGLISLISLGGTFALTAQPSYAQIPLNSKDSPLTPKELTGRSKGTSLMAEEKVDRAYALREGAGMQEEKREQAYEEATKAAKDPQGFEKVYEQDVKAFKKAHPEESLAGKAKEKAQELVEDVTGSK